MNKTDKLVVGVMLAFLVSGCAIGAFIGVKAAGTKFGGAGAYEALKTHWGNGLFAGQSKQFEIDQNGAVTIGLTGTDISGVQFGMCELRANGAIGATSTKEVDCAVSGALSTDTVLSGGIASSTIAGGGINVIGVRASTTANYLTFTLVNLTGASYTFAGKGYGSSTPYLIIR